MSSALSLPLTILPAINTKFDSNLSMIQTIEILEPPAKCKKCLGNRMNMLYIDRNFWNE